jgi:hypothetical protein
VLTLPLWLLALMVLFPSAMAAGLTREYRKLAAKRHVERDDLCEQIAVLRAQEQDLKQELINTRAELGLATGKYSKTAENPINSGYLIDEDS